MKATRWSFGMSTASHRMATRQTFEDYAAAGVDCAEISLPWQQYADADWHAMAKNARECGIRLWSFHLPFCPFEQNNIASPDPALRAATVKMQSELLRRAGDMGIGIAIIHPSGEPNAEEQRRDMIAAAKESLAQLAEVGAAAGVTVAVEDLPRTCIGRDSADIRELLTADERLKVCFDTNHLLSEKNRDFIQNVGSKIVTLHVSDYDFIDERHWLPGEGKIDWTELVTELENVGYAGPFLYEVSLNTALKAGDRVLTVEDFRRNYESCVNKRL